MDPEDPDWSAEAEMMAAPSAQTTAASEMISGDDWVDAEDDDGVGDLIEDARTALRALARGAVIRAVAVSPSRTTRHRPGRLVTVQGGAGVFPGG